MQTDSNVSQVPLAFGCSIKYPQTSKNTDILSAASLSLWVCENWWNQSKPSLDMPKPWLVNSLLNTCWNYICHIQQSINLIDNSQVSPSIGNVQNVSKYILHHHSPGMNSNKPFWGHLSSTVHLYLIHTYIIYTNNCTCTNLVLNIYI